MLAVELDLRDFLRSRLPRLVPTLAFDQVIAYHGTRTDALQSIRDNGILAHPFKHYHPERFYKGVRGASVYLAANPAVAASWALSEVDDPAQVTILEVVVPAQGLRPDEEAPQAERYEGDIPPEWIHAVYPLLPDGKLGKPTALESPTHAADAPMRRRYLVVRHAGAHGAQDEWDETKHPRKGTGEGGGRFVSAGGGGGGAAGLDPAVVKVGGDKWNQETAVRLERQYQSAKPEIDDLFTDILEGKSGVEAHLPAPKDWESLTGSTQAEAEEKWKKDNYDSVFESEKDHWWETDSEHAAKFEVVASFENSRDWAADAVKEWLADREADEQEGFPPVPYTLAQLTEALTLNMPEDEEGDLEIGFDDEKLQDPDINTQKETLPGIEPEDLSDHLTKEMREDLIAAIEGALKDELKEAQNNLEPPDYLNESAQESVDMMWDEMSDGEKYEWAKENVEGIQEEEDEYEDEDGAPMIKGEPNKWDPLNETTGADYRKTQAIARHLSIARAAQLIRERGLAHGWSAAKESDIEDEIAHLDAHLWLAWKDSSTSAGGKMLQLATADELDGRLRNETINDIERKQLIGRADNSYSSIGGYAGLKAIVRAKWETTQFLLAKAGIKEVQVYRGLSIYGVGSERRYAVKGYDRLPDVTLQRNGAASTTTDRDVADNWDGHDRLVLRIAAPRTAVLSVPAYGVNVQSEHEVVLAGTAWKSWDAWYRQAPPVATVPIGEPVPEEAGTKAPAETSEKGTLATAELYQLAAQAGLHAKPISESGMHEFITPNGGHLFFSETADNWALWPPGMGVAPISSGKGMASVLETLKSTYGDQIEASEKEKAAASPKPFLKVMTDVVAGKPKYKESLNFKGVADMVSGYQYDLKGGGTLWASGSTDHWAITEGHGKYVHGQGQVDLDAELKKLLPPQGEVLIPPKGGIPVDQFHEIDDAMKAAGVTLLAKETSSGFPPGTVYKLPHDKGLLYIWHEPVGEHEKSKWSFSIGSGGESGADLADLPAAIAAKAPTTAAGVAELQKQPY